MTRLAKLQLIGPIVLAITIIAAELAAYLLALKPSSSLAWYLNMEVFGSFQRSHYVLSDRLGIPYLQLLLIAVPMLAMAALAVFWRKPLLIALTSHFGFIYACFHAYAWHLVSVPSLRAASLSQEPQYLVLNFPALELTAQPQMMVILALLVATSISFAGSHVHYVRAAFRS